MGAVLSSPLFQKIATAGIGLLVDFVNKKYNLGLDRTTIIAAMVSVIGGIALHNAAKDHGVNAEAGAK